MFFVLVDSHSKWAEVVEITSTTSPAIIKVLRQFFATYGLPKEIISGQQFSYTEFQIFLKSNGVKHIRCAPYHPSNGVVERFIQTFKKGVRAVVTEDATFHQKLMNFLLVYCTTPHIA